MLKRPLEDRVMMIVDGHPRKRQHHAVSDVLERQQLLASLCQAAAIGPSHSDYTLYEHAQTCESLDCFFEECPMARKCLAHFRKCAKPDCIMCVEARLNQVTESNAEATPEHDVFLFSMWRARLQSVNTETREFVPYFNECAKEVEIAKLAKSPFLNAAKERLQVALTLVKQSEAKYSSLCSEIFARWQSLHVQEEGTTTDAASATEENSSWGTQSPRAASESSAEEKAARIDKVATEPSWSNLAEDNKDSEMFEEEQPAT